MHVTASLTPRRQELWPKGHVQWFPVQALVADDAAGADGAAGAGDAAAGLAGAAESLLVEGGGGPAASVPDRAGAGEEPEVLLSVL